MTMAEKEEPVFTLIGDIVASRRASDRSRLQAQVGEALERMNAVLEPRVPLEPTIGDEFQACFADVAKATRASLMVQLELLRIGGIDSRYGLGVGPVEDFAEARRFSQDGPGWWTAREAIDTARHTANSPHTSFVRTCFSAVSSRSQRWEGEAAALNAFLLCRDAMVHQMKQPSRNRLYGLMHGWSQSKIAEEEKTTQSAISQSLRSSGAFAVLTAQHRLEQQVQ